MVLKTMAVSVADESMDVADQIRDSLTGILTSAIDFIPRIIAALVVVLIGSILAKWISKLVGKAFGFVEDNKAVKDFLEKAGLKQVKIGDIVSAVVKWVILIVFYSTAADLLEMQVLSDTVSSLIDYIPKLLAALIVGAVVYIGSNVLGDLVDATAKKAGMKIHSTLATITRVMVMIFGVPLAAAQLGLNLDIINNNITVIVAGVVAAFAIAFGMGGREVAGKILDDMYNKYNK